MSSWVIYFVSAPPPSSAVAVFCSSSLRLCYGGKVLSADSSAGGATTGIKMRNSSRVSPGLAARMQAMKINPAAGSSSPIMGSGAGEGSGEREDPPPLPSSSTVPPIPVNRPPGISARLEVCRIFFVIIIIIYSPW